MRSTSTSLLVPLAGMTLTDRMQRLLRVSVLSAQGSTAARSAIVAGIGYFGLAGTVLIAGPDMWNPSMVVDRLTVGLSYGSDLARPQILGRAAALYDQGMAHPAPRVVSVELRQSYLSESSAAFPAPSDRSSGFDPTSCFRLAPGR